MKDDHTYLIQLRGPVDIDELNTIGPLEVKPIQVNTTATSFTFCTDQSGLMGLLRHLHARGHVLLSITTSKKNDEVIEKRTK